VIYDSGIPLYSKLAAIIKDGDWFWPSARSDDLVAIQSQLHDVVLGEDNIPEWDSRDGKYYCTDA
jgi:transposase